MPRLLLIDGSGYIFRAYYSLPPMNRPDGTPVNAVYGFCAMVAKLIRSKPADAIGCIFDASGQSFRNDIYPAYKANRLAAPEDLIPQFPLIREASRAYNLATVEQLSYEADDLIATYSRLAVDQGYEVEIVSSDKDLLQLMSNRVQIYDPMKNKTLGTQDVVAKFGVGPELLGDLLAMSGDSSDNVPGVPGIGPKTAAELLHTYGSLEEILAQAHHIKQPKRRENLQKFADQARLSRQLVTLEADVPLTQPLSTLQRQAVDPSVLVAFLDAQGFHSLIERHASLFSQNGGPSAQHSRPEHLDTEPELPHEAPLQLPQTLQRDPPVQDLDRFCALAVQNGVFSIFPDILYPASVAEIVYGLGLATAPGPLGLAAPQDDETQSQMVFYVPLHPHLHPHLPSHLPESPAPGNADRDPAQSDTTSPTVATDCLQKVYALLQRYDVQCIGFDLKTLFNALHFRSAPLEAEIPPLTTIGDCQLLSFALDAGRSDHSLATLLAPMLDATQSELLTQDCRNAISTIAKQKLSAKARQASPDTITDACAIIAASLLPLYEQLKARLKPEQQHTVYQTVDLPLLEVLAKAERRGILVDKDSLEAFSLALGQQIAEHEDAIFTYAGKTFAIGSPQQLATVLFDDLELPVIEKTATGQRSTSADVLEQLMVDAQDSKAKAFLEHLLGWRSATKLKSTYADTLPKEIRSHSQRIHTSYNVTGAQTGRIASINPNLQNIPIRSELGRHIRRAFVAAPGFTLVSFDYAQVELRIAAIIANIPEMKHAFDAGEDIHRTTAAAMLNVPISEITPADRYRAKAINFGILYGVSAFGLARQLNCSRSEAKTFMERYLTRFPGIADYMQQQIDTCTSRHFVATLLGRKIHLPAIASSHQAARKHAQRQAINASIQGTAADVIKRAMLLADHKLRSANLEAYLLLQVHDELLYEIAEHALEAATDLITQAMCEAGDQLNIPLSVSSGSGQNWEQAH